MIALFALPATAFLFLAIGVFIGVRLGLAQARMDADIAADTRMALVCDAADMATDGDEVWR